MIRVLHLFGDWKWTGPAEPVLDLCVELREAGCDVTLACPVPPAEANRSLLQEAGKRKMPVVTDFSLRRLSAPWRNVPDVLRLARWIDARGTDIVHTHMTHDHAVGFLASRLSAAKPRVVRSSHTGLPIGSGLLRRFLFKDGADAVSTFSERAYHEDRAWLNGHAPRYHWVRPGMRLERFRSDQDPAAVRRQVGVRSDDVVFGIVARMQRHRRFDVLLQAFAMALKERPNLKLMIIGRGTHWEEVAKRPAERLGLGASVIFTGYLKENYLDGVNAFDVGLFLVPGSDGTCRALRELMAMGKPAIGARRGMIPEIIEHDRTGWVVDDTPEHLAAAMIKMADDPALRRRMGEESRRRVREQYAMKDHVKQFMDLYTSLKQGACK